MARRANMPLGDLAADVLSAVEHDLVKNATVTYTKEAAVNSEVAQLMVKLAAAIREDRAEISYDDLSQFRKRYDV